MAQLGAAQAYLAAGDLATASAEVERLIAATVSSADRALQALAWETKARVAMARTELESAKRDIERALTVLEGFEVPLAAWRVHATAWDFYLRAGSAEKAELHRSHASSVILRLADSLPPSDPLRELFLAAAPIRRVLESSRIDKAKQEATESRPRKQRQVEGNTAFLQKVETSHSPLHWLRCKGKRPMVGLRPIEAVCGGRVPSAVSNFFELQLQHQAHRAPGEFRIRKEDMKNRLATFAALGLLLLSWSRLNGQGQENQPLKLVQTIPMPGVQGRMDHLGVDIKGKRLFAAALGDNQNTVEVLDLKAGKRIASIPGQSKPQGVFYSPDFKRLFVANGGDGTCKIFRGDNFQPITALPLDNDANHVGYDPATKYLYVGNGDAKSGQLSIIDTRTNQHVGDKKSEARPGGIKFEKSGALRIVPVGKKGPAFLSTSRRPTVWSTLSTGTPARW